MTASNLESQTAPNPMEREVTLIRVYDAPRELVFKAWTDPKHLARWFGPKGFTNPVCEVDPQVGGAWHIVMRGPDGAEYPCGGVYREIVEPEKLAFTNNAVDKEGKLLIEGFTSVTFDDENGKTKLTLQTRAVGHVSFAGQMLKGMEAGWSQSLDRLDTLVLNAQKPNVLSMSRRFEASPELVFDAWTNPEAVSRWLFTCPTSETHDAELDVRVGGKWTIRDRRDGVDYMALGEYIEVDPPRRLVFTFGMPQFSSEFCRVTVEIAPEGAGCAMTLTQNNLPWEYQKDTEEGWNKMFDTLSEQLTR